MSGPYLNICCLPSCLERSSLTSAILGVQLARRGGGHPPQPRTISHMVRVREELTVLNTVTTFAWFLFFYRSAKESSNKGGMSFPSGFFQSFKGKLSKDDNYLFSSRVRVPLKHLGIILMNKHFKGNTTFSDPGEVTALALCSAVSQV